MSRHIVSLALALVLAPVIYLSAGLCVVKLGAADGFNTDAGLGLGAAVVAGGLVATLVMARISPVGPTLAGLIFIGATCWTLADPDALGFIPADIAGVDGVGRAAVPVLTTLLAVPLVSTVVSPRRWRRLAESGAVGYNAAPTYPSEPGSAAPEYGQMFSAAPTYDSGIYTPPSYSTSSFGAPSDPTRD